MERDLNRSSISAYLDKKRKLLDEEEGELLEIRPPPNHLFCVQKKLKSNIFAGQLESDQESSEKGSSNISVLNATETTQSSSSYDCSSSSCPKAAHECFDPSSSSANWVGPGTSSSEIADMCSSESISFENQNSSASQPSPIDGDDYYEDHHLLTDGYEHLKELDNLLYSCIASPGISPVNQDNNKQRGNAKKLTIDKEFEEYFSSLML